MPALAPKSDDSVKELLFKLLYNQAAFIDAGGGGGVGGSPTTENVNVATTAANVTLTTASLPYQLLTPDANRDVSLPATTTDFGFFTIKCRGGTAFALTVKTSGGTTLAILPDETTATVIWNNTAGQWEVL